MLADFFMKPLQGSLFTKFQDIILGVNHATSVSPDSRSVLGDDATSQAQDGATHPVVGLSVPYLRNNLLMCIQIMHRLSAQSKHTSMVSICIVRSWLGQQFQAACHVLRLIK